MKTARACLCLGIDDIISIGIIPALFNINHFYQLRGNSMKHLSKIAVVALPIMLVGCSSSTPDCGDSDAKDIVFEIIKDNQRAETLNALNNRVTRYEKQVKDLQEQIMTSQQIKEKVRSIQDSHESGIAGVDSQFITEAVLQKDSDVITATHEQRTAELQSQIKRAVWVKPRRR